HVSRSNELSRSRKFPTSTHLQRDCSDARSRSSDAEDIPIGCQRSPLAEASQTSRMSRDSLFDSIGLSHGPRNFSHRERRYSSAAAVARTFLRRNDSQGHAYMGTSSLHGRIAGNLRGTGLPRRPAERVKTETAALSLGHCNRYYLRRVSHDAFPHRAHCSARHDSDRHCNHDWFYLSWNAVACRQQCVWSDCGELVQPGNIAVGGL